MNSFSTLGAALMIDELAEHLAWLSEGARDLEIQDFSQHELLDSNWEDKLSQAQDILRGYPGRIGIHGPFWGLDLASPDPMIQRVVSQRLTHGLEIAGRLGATHMVIHSPVEAWSHRHILNNARDKARTLEFLYATLQPVIKDAESLACTLVLENIMDLDPRLQLDLVKAMNSELVKMSVDVGHAYCMHKQHGAPPADQFIAEAGGYLAHVHFQDSDGYLDRHWLPGQGSIHFLPILEEIGKLEQAPRLIIEVKDKSNIQQAHDYLMACR